jgi:signal transduction histidine kinase
MVIDDALTFTVLADYRQNLERKVTERTAELAKTRDDLAATVAQLEEAQQIRARFFANINHEIRSPLSLVLLAVAEVQTHLGAAFEGRTRRNLETIERSSHRLLRLVDDLLLLAAGQESKLRLQFRPADIAAEMSQIAAAWTLAAESRGVTLTYEGLAECTMAVDIAAFERIVTNVISNAVKYTPRGGRIEVRLTAADPQVRITVRDTGVGIDDDFRARIFGRFEQSKAAVHAGVQGSGIGLALVKQLCEAHGGSVELVSTGKDGSTFAITLPRGAAVPAATPETSTPRPTSERLTPASFGLSVLPPARGAPSPVREVSVGPATANATLLVAEDEPELRAAIVDILSAEFRVLAAPDGQRALEIAREQLPHLLITDLQMPHMDGIELTRRFREMPGNRLAPVVVLTTFGTLGSRLSGFEAGAVDYVLKPFEPAELMARVRSLLSMRGMALRLHESEKLAALGVMSAGLAHEIRNPANALVNAIGPLRQLLPTEQMEPGLPLAQLVDVLEQCSTQIAALSKQLLGFRRPGELACEPVEVSELVRRASVLVAPAFETVTLKRELDYTGTIDCARTLFVQVLANLLENGAHAAEAGGWVKIHTRSDGARFILEVSDSGKGVPPELRERIFEPFFTTKAPGKGTGLGLTTSREIVVRHGGILEVRERDEGTVFYLEIPLRKAAELCVPPAIAHGIRS